jgi:hypothetical protein
MLVTNIHGFMTYSKMALITMVVNRMAFGISICNIGNITFCLMMAKYLPMLPRGKTV